MLAFRKNEKSSWPSIGQDVCMWSSGYPWKHSLPAKQACQTAKILGKSQENHRKTISKLMVTFMTIFWPFIVEVYLNNTFNSFIDFFRFRLV